MTQAVDARFAFLDRSRRGPIGRLIVDMVKYGAASGVALALDAMTLLCLNKILGVNYLLAAAIGFLLGLLLVYALSVRYVFRDSRTLHPSHEALGFLVTGLVGLVLNEALMGFFVGEMGLGVAMAKLPTVAVVFAFNFTARRSLLFSNEIRAQAMDFVRLAADIEYLSARLAAFPLWGTIALAAAAAIGLTFPQTQQVWSTGAFFDTDDAMRAVQVRDLLAGQPWFDMTSYRLDPPAGVFSHWSRVVDAPLAAMQLFFRLFLSTERAEIVARLLFPLALLVLLFRLSPWYARALDTTASRHIAVFLALLTGAMYMQFVPGRIDHHAPQIVLLMTAFGFFLRGLDPAFARAMLPASAAMALSLAISLENLPFFAVMLASAPIIFALDGAKLRPVLLWLAAGIGLCIPATYAATVAPSRYLIAACDAYSSVYVGAFLVGATALAALSLFSARLSTIGARACAVGIAALAVVATFIAIHPQCVGDPLGGVDPLVRELWLSHVTEATPLWKFWKRSPNVIPTTALPVLFGFAVALAQALRTKDLVRQRWAIAAAMVAVGFLGGMFWQVRIFTSVTPLAMAPLVVLVAALAERVTASFSALTRALCAFVICLAVTPVGWATVLPQTDQDEALSAKPAPAAEQKKKPDYGACRKREVLSTLAQIAPARVVASFDFGPYLLAYTQHSAFAGPYHRDNQGNRLLADAFLAEPSAAETILRKAGAQLVLWCPGEPAGFIKLAPNGLAAALSRGETPTWLARKDMPGTSPLAVYELK